jgi:putative phosphotransacetylase
MELHEIIKRVMAEVKKAEGIPVGVSNRHIHLSQEDLEILFGKNAKLTPIKELSQPGQFAAEECVTLVGAKGTLEKVRVLGPVREKTQVEILASDSFKIGIKAVLRESGKLEATPGIAVVGTMGCLQLKEGVIVAQRHIHMSEEDSKRFSVVDGQLVKVQFGGTRGGIYEAVLVRVSNKYKLDFHVDMDEANALLLKDKDFVQIVI